MNMLAVFITHVCARIFVRARHSMRLHPLIYWDPYAHLSNKFRQKFKTKVTKPYSVTTPNRTRPRPNRTKPRRNRTEITQTVPNNIENDADFSGNFNKDSNQNVHIKLTTHATLVNGRHMAAFMANMRPNNGVNRLQLHKNKYKSNLAIVSTSNLCLLATNQTPKCAKMKHFERITMTLPTSKQVGQIHCGNDM